MISQFSLGGETRAARTRQREPSLKRRRRRAFCTLCVECAPYIAPRAQPSPHQCQSGRTAEQASQGDLPWNRMGMLFTRSHGLRASEIACHTLCHRRALVLPAIIAEMARLALPPPQAWSNFARLASPSTCTQQHQDKRNNHAVGWGDADRYLLWSTAAGCVWIVRLFADCMFLVDAICNARVNITSLNHVRNKYNHSSRFCGRSHFN